MEENNGGAGQIQPGLAVIHSNQMENLRLLVVAWMRQHPLAPLENEVVLVQSNGMAQWLKMALADDREGLGICAAVSTQLPARFLWSAYQTVLGEDVVPDESPFDREALIWRLFRLLPERLGDTRFAPLQRFLANDQDARKRHQLAACLAGLYDQYQVYRADWLHDWTDGRDQLRDARRDVQAIPEEQAWQAALWRSVLQDVPEVQRHTSRAWVHEQFITALENFGERPDGLPRRIVVFGVSSLPHQMLRALAALSRFCQVLLCVHNPCRYYWADIIEHKELLRAERRRQQLKVRMPATLKSEDLHLYANPLLAAWGKQGRDYIRLLDEWDDPERYRAWFQNIDLFEDYGQPKERTLLQQIQQAILDLESLPQVPGERPVIRPDGSLVFHCAHSPQREVEILHDQLLALFAESAEKGEYLSPRDIVVMVPDISAYAPHIRAVFGQVEPGDPRYIPYSLADQRERGQDPLLIALESLLRLPESRFAVSDLLSLLDVTAVRQRFGLAEADISILHRWIDGAGIRWGLHATQRSGLGLPARFEQNTWRFGLRRMLLGYAVGNGEAWGEIEPYEEIGGLDAALIGPLARILDALEAYWESLREPAPPALWGERLRGLLETFFSPTNDRDHVILEKLFERLEHWEAVCQQAGLEENLPLSIVREAWLSGLDEAGLEQRFLTGGVTFCTLLPMRAIPFKVVCLMGMNDGAYPRCQMPPSFDLMAIPGGYRPGDRSRRDDDRYLFLEALLSARRSLYISWVGRSARDNSECPPSLLVAQLRDYIAAGWQAERSSDDAETDPGRLLLDQLTVEHPLQPFSPRYFLPETAEGHDPRLFSYAHEWRAAHVAADESAPVPVRALEPLVPNVPLTLATLAEFLRYPVRRFFNDRLEVWFEKESAVGEDLEPFAFDGFQRFTLGNKLLQAALNGPSDEAWERFEAAKARQRRRGQLPFASFAAPAQARFAEPAWIAYQRAETVFARWPGTDRTPKEIRLEFQMPDGAVLSLEDWLSGLRHDERGGWAHILVHPQEISKDKQPKWHNLVRPWVKHLAGCAAGLTLETLQVGPDKAWWLPAIPEDQAYAWLKAIVDAWYRGMQAPLPLACKTAFAWLAKSAEPDSAIKEARKIYEGGNWGDQKNRGEVQEDPYLARAFPTFDELWHQPEDGHFVHWAQAVYEPLLQSVRDHQEDQP